MNDKELRLECARIASCSGSTVVEGTRNIVAAAKQIYAFVTASGAKEKSER